MTIVPSHAESREARIAPKLEARLVYPASLGVAEANIRTASIQDLMHYHHTLKGRSAPHHDAFIGEWILGKISINRQSTATRGGWEIETLSAFLSQDNEARKIVQIVPGFLALNP